MKTFDIYWSDLNVKAKAKFKELYHDNIDLNPIAIIEIEEDESEFIDEDDDINIDIRHLNKTDYD